MRRGVGIANRPCCLGGSRLLVGFLLGACFAGHLYAVGAACAQEPAKSHVNAPSPTDQQNIAALRAEGLEAFSRGAFEQAVAAWKQASEIAKQSENSGQEIEVNALAARAYAVLGQYGEAQKTLASVLVKSQQPRLKAERALLLSELGDVYATTGPREKAYEYLREARHMAEEQQNGRLSSAILNNLGNLLASDGQFSEAAAAYEGSLKKAEESKDQGLAVRSLSNAAMLENRIGKPEQAKKLVDRAYTRIDKLGDNHDTAFVLTNIGIIYTDLSRQKGSLSAPQAAQRAV